MSQKESINVKFLAYEVRVKQIRKNFISVENVYNLLKRINGLPYKRRTDNSKDSRFQSTNDGFGLCMNFSSNFSSLDKNKLNIIDVVMDKEVDETYYSKDLKGKYGLAKLEEGKLYCHKTHCRFIFKFKDNFWRLIVLLEKRHHNVWISHVFKYLKKFEKGWIYDNSQMSRTSDLVKKLDSINDSKLVLVQNLDILLATEPNETAGDKLFIKKMKEHFQTRKMELVVKEEGLKGFLKDIFRIVFKQKDVILDVKNLNKLSSMVALKIYGKTEEKNFFHWEDFFSDLILYSITVDKDNKNNELKTEVVFKELEKICPYEEMDSLFFIKLTK